MFIMGLFKKVKYTLICSRCGQKFESDFKPTPGRVLNCKKCDEQILLGKLAKVKDESERKKILNQLLMVRQR